MKSSLFHRRYSSAADVPAIKTYEGRRENGITIVTVDGRPLPDWHDLLLHSFITRCTESGVDHRTVTRWKVLYEDLIAPGFDWGHGGGGPSQLALALLADHLGNDEQALALYQEFKFRVIAGLPEKWWKLTSHDIDKALRRIAAKMEATP